MIRRAAYRRVTEGVKVDVYLSPDQLGRLRLGEAVTVASGAISAEPGTDEIDFASITVWPGAGQTAGDSGDPYDEADTHTFADDPD